MRNSHRISPETILVSDNQAVSAVCWFYNRDDVYLFKNGGELSYGLKYDNPKGPRLLTMGRFNRLIRKSTGNNRVVLMINIGRYLRSKHLIPEPAFEDIDSGFVFAQF